MNQKSDILEQIFTQLKTHFTALEQPLLQHFINAIYRDVSIVDLTTISPADLSGLTVSLWREAQEWNGQVAKIKVFNPDVEQDEWQSTHTIISVLSRNIPFVIDTLKIVLNKQNINLHRILYSEIHSERSKSGQLKAIKKDNDTELLLYIEIDHTTSPTERLKIKKSLDKALSDVSLVVDDHEQMITKVKGAMVASKKANKNPDQALAEEQTYLSWMVDNHFTFVACDEFTVKDNTISIVENSQLEIERLKQLLKSFSQ